jgi:uncharacterized UPF0160 family protein
MKIKIGTHSGSFHADDVFAIATLSFIYPEYEIIRSRDEEVLGQCDYLVDVGGVYDHENKIYDHHFRNGPAYEDGLAMSSVGLIWKHYGEKVCGNQDIADRVCQKLIRSLDANDNGVTLSQPVEDDFGISEVSISGIIAIMNPPDLENVDEVFGTEVIRAKAILEAFIAKAKHWYNSKAEVDEVVAKALQNKRQYIEVSEGCNWMEHLLNNEDGQNILFACFPNGPKWYARTVSVVPKSFDSRKDFPEAWAGLRDEEFSKAAGIDDGVFCHHGLFICGAGSRESILKLLELAIQA